ALGFERLDDAHVRKSPRRAASQRERDLGRGGRRGGLVRQIRARRQKSEERDRGGTEHGGTLRETDGSLPETRPEREIVADSSPVPVRAGIFRLSSKKDRKFLRVRAAKCARFAACFGSLSGASRWDRSWPRLRGLHASGLMANNGSDRRAEQLEEKVSTRRLNVERVSSPSASSPGCAAFPTYSRSTPAARGVRRY